ncbi:MAG: site-specific integrase [Planctomycetota bacterium]
MGELRRKMEEDLKLKGFSPCTAKVYLLYCRKFAAHYGRSPEVLGEEEIRKFLLHLIQVEQVSHYTYRQIFASLKFLYTVTLSREWEVDRIPFPKHRQNKLPEVLNNDQVLALLEALQSPKYRAIMTSCYAAGLRISEACRLRVDEIDSNRMVIRVRQGKGCKERYTLLSPRLLEMLRVYWRIYRPMEWMFPGRTQAGHVSPDTVRQVFSKARVAAGIGRWCTPHTLRHAFATHLLDRGTDLAVIQTLLGHASIETTRIYTHVTIEHIQKTESPLDHLPQLQAEEKS